MGGSEALPGRGDGEGQESMKWRAPKYLLRCLKIMAPILDGKLTLVYER